MIEEVLERIVMALEERNALQKRQVECVEWQVRYLSEKTEAPAAPAAANAVPDPTADIPAAAPVAPAAPEAEDASLNRDALLKECKELGVEVPAKTRTTTLAKLVAEARVKVPEAIKAEEAALEEEMENSVNPATPAKPMTSAEARAILNEAYDGSERDRNILREALKCVNATKFCEVQDGQFDEVVRVFRVIKKEALKNG